MKRLPSMSLVVALAATVPGCGDTDPGAKIAQRDVYAGPMAFEHCVADWGNEELCKQRLDEEEAKKLAAAGHHGGGGGAIVPMFLYGPGYYGGVREVVHNGNKITPTATRAVQTAQFNPTTFRPASYSAPRPATSFSAGGRPSTAPVARGGFGSTGHGVSSGG